MGPEPRVPDDVSASPAGAARDGLFAGSPALPALIAETDDYAVVYKPPRMHSSPLVNGEGKTLVEWYAKIFPPVTEIAGRKPLDGGLLHRLDFETHGLLLFAKRQAAMDHFMSAQKNDLFIKEYGALVRGKAGAPPFIESYFRPFGKGRKEVRPVIDPEKNRKETVSDRGKPYRTEILAAGAIQRAESPGGDSMYLRLRVRRGFRHQIRSHLAWIGMPILNDTLYGPDKNEGHPEETGGIPFLALRCEALLFPDPRTGENRAYRLPPLCAVHPGGAKVF
jgi:23S rRNA pseudouridine1911/1915/1917 synthase